MTLGRAPTKEEQDLVRGRHLRGQRPYSDEQDATIVDLTKELSDAEAAYKLDLTKRDTQIADLKTSLSSIKTQIAEAKTAEAEAAAAIAAAQSKTKPKTANPQINSLIRSQQAAKENARKYANFRIF